MSRIRIFDRKRSPQDEQAEPTNTSRPDAGAADRQKTGEPVSFAWTDPADTPRVEAAPKRTAKEPRVVLVGRGPSIAERLALATPHPTTIAAGAAVVLVAVTGLALMSPSSDQATATRSNAPYGVASSETPNANTGLTSEEFAALEGNGKAGAKRDPFVSKNYADDQAKARARTKQAAAAKAKAREQKLEAQQRAKRAAAMAPAYLGDFVYYSDYTPWERLKGTPGDWLTFDGQNTLMVDSVTRNTAELFVVSDVEVIDDKGRGYTYSYPLRRLRLTPGAVVRFADYRDVQGDDVTYTLRFRGSVKNPKHSK